MKPIILKINAFGPFASTEVVDFRKVERFPLFGIYGETGAGKSSIFDSIAYALFGKTLKQSDQDSLKSHHSQNMECKIEFIFSIEDKIYRILRSPKQEINQKKIQTSAFLFDVTNNDIDNISEQNPGKIIVEKKSNLVNKRLEEILGYGFEQFSKIVILPQGEFEKFLKSKTSEKRKILSDLFDVEIYKKLSEKFLEDTKLEEENLKVKKKTRDELIGEFVNLETLERRINETDTEINKYKKKKEICDKQINSLIKKKETRDDFQKKEKNYLELKNNKNNYDNEEKKLEKINDSLSLKNISKQVRSSNHELENTKSRLKEIQKKELHNENLLKKKKSDQKSIFRNENEKTNEQNKLQKLSEQLKKTKSIQESKNKLLEIKKKLDEVDKVLKKRKLNEDLEEVQNYQSLKQSEKNQRSELNKFKQKIKEEKINLSEIEKKYNDAEKKLSQQQSIHLASKLEKNRPCPVCGSTDHPKPAKGTIESKGLNDEFQKFKVKLNEKKNEIQELRIDEVKLSSDLQKKIKDLENLKVPKFSISILENKLRSIKFNTELEQMNQKEINNIKESLRVSELKIEGFLEKEDQNLDEKKLSEEIHKIKSNLNTYTDIKKDLEKFTMDKISLETEKREVQKQINSETEKNEKLNNELEKKRIILGFNNQFDLEKYWKLESQKNDIKRKIDEFKINYEIAKNNYNEAKKQINSSELQNYEIIKKKIVEAKQNQNNIEQILENLKNELFNHRNTKEKISDLDKVIKDLEEKNLSMINISNLFNAKNYRKLNLETFVLQIMFELVLESSNNRLLSMTNRYKLNIDTEYKGGGEKGLDLIIEDLHTGTKREVDTLSGGETFIASLALALGLSDVTQSTSKKNIRLDTIFIDEGFGSLDTEDGHGTLGNVLETLNEKVAKSRSVGLISHIEAVKENVCEGFLVVKTKNGSSIKVRNT